MPREDRDIYDEIWWVADESFYRANIPQVPARLRKANLSLLYSLRMAATKRDDRTEVTQISLEIVQREISEARRDSSAKAHNKAVIALISLVRQTAFTLRGSNQSAREMSRNLVGEMSGLPKWLVQYLGQPPKLPRPPRYVAELSGLTLEEWNAFTKRVVEITRSRAQVVKTLTDKPVAVDLNVAARLSRMAATDRPDRKESPTYDLSDRSRRITSVTVHGFRGSPGTVALSLLKNDKPVDALIWGDNGVGKSTLVDGIEFALQRRVDRSSDFNSSLRPSVRNLTMPSAQAAVELDDGSVLERSLSKNEAGRDEPSSSEVRPGFRIAPIVIRRADILRFLDTEALSRGTVFFDYFPDPSGTIGERPDEELRQLEEERFLIRVARDDLSAQLKLKFPEAGIDFRNAKQVSDFIEAQTQDGGSQSYGSVADRFEADTYGLITELQSAQRRSSVIKRKLERGVETLNPIAYQAQLDRIVPILQTVTGDLTESFKRIARASHVVAIQVLVAKSGPVSLDVVVEFDNGASALPQQVFSEGYKDLIALLFFLTVTKKAADFGQAKVLVLDDALQSVDASIRIGVMDYIIEEFKDWQLIVTGHDRAWFAQLRGLFQRRGRNFVERNISGWSFEEGIEVAGSALSRAESLRGSISRADERMVAAGTGLLLEEVASELSWRIGISVIRREGDRYTLGDLWPGLAKALRNTEAGELVRSIQLRLDIRNLLGAHYNEWADEIAWSDIRQLGEDVLALYAKVYCSNCASWLVKTGAAMGCRCGDTHLE